jgi:GTP cyclohydrolase IA
VTLPPEQVTPPGLPMGSLDAYRRSEITRRYGEILQLLGYDLHDEHIRRTPERATEAMWGFRKNGAPEELAAILGVEFESQHDSLVQVGPIRVVSMCAHHVLPVIGWAWAGYIPDSKVTGLSKLVRVVEYFARQLTVQERLTQQVAEALDEYLQPLGSICVIQASHGCMSMRGVEEPCALTVTSAVRGVFLKEPSAKQEFMALMTSPMGMIP